MPQLEWSHCIQSSETKRKKTKGTSYNWQLEILVTALKEPKQEKNFPPPRNIPLITLNWLGQMKRGPWSNFRVQLMPLFNYCYSRVENNVVKNTIRAISNGNRTEWSPIRSVIILVIKQIGLPLRGRPILLITRMNKDRIGLHSVLLPLLSRRTQTYFRWRVVTTGNRSVSAGYWCLLNGGECYKTMQTMSNGWQLNFLTAK